MLLTPCWIADFRLRPKASRFLIFRFVRRFLLHVLPSGVKRIRHYGLLAAACKTAKDFMARVAKIDVMLCPHCQVGRLHVVQVLPGQARLPAPEVGTAEPANRGPP